MSLSKILFAFLLVGILPSCGFQPLYGHRSGVNANAELAAIRIKPIKDRIGQKAHNHLLDLLTPHGRPASPKFVLEVKLTEGSSNVAVSKESFATRVNYHLSANINLLDARTNKNIFNGNTRVVTSYNVLTSNFATQAAENDARSRAAREIAFNIQTQIASFLKQNISDKNEKKK